MAAPDRIEASFEDDMLKASGGLADPDYYWTLAQHAVETIGWLQAHGVAFSIPVYYLSIGPPRIQPAGGGREIVERLLQSATRAGVKIRYDCPAARLGMANSRINGVTVRSNDDVTTTVDADAVILATGGFQGSRAMMLEHFGAGAETLKLIAPGTGYDTGDGIRMATDRGANVSGDWNGMHIEPVDPRSGHPAPVVLVYPYGIVVDQNGKRFFDEGAGLVHETWEAFARDIHFARPHRTESTLEPSKSNWARPITQPPFLAYPLIGAIAYTFGGLATNVRAEVLSMGGPISGLYAVGETTGHFYGTAPNAMSVLRALVFGKIAGRQAVDFLAQE
jgi:tricarballylate dehydrogenase